MLELFASVPAEKNALTIGIIVLTSHQSNSYKTLVREALKSLNPASPGGSGLQPLERH